MTKLSGALILAVALQAETASFRPLHVSPVGIVVDDSGSPVLLRGLNRSGAGSGNADANSTDQDYAAQNQLLSMNLVRIFVNATWWTNNVTVPIAGLPYQTYIDGLVQRAKKYGNYVLIVKAGQFPEPPCGSSGANCPAANQGDLDCQANASLCPAEGTAGNYVDAAISFWAAVAQKYAADPAVLYDTWEDMHSIDMGTWSDGQNQLIATIRSYNPQALIFVEDTASAFEAIVSGALPDLAWPNVVWNFHLYAGPSGTCTETASPRYANWPHNFDPLVSYAQQYGHAAAIMEWGGCNDSDPYHSNVTSYAQAHDLALAYFDSGNLIAQSGGAYQLTATGTKVAGTYASIIAAGPPANSGDPVVQRVLDAINNRAQIVPGSWVSVYGGAFSAIVKDWSDQSFANGLPTAVADVQVLVDGSPAPVWYVSPGQINFQAPTTMGATASVAVARNGVASAPTTVSVVSSSPGVISYSADYVTFYPSAQFAGTTTIVGDPAVFGSAVKKAKPGDQIQLYATGLASTQSGVLINAPITFPSPVKVNVGSVTVTASYAGQIGAGYYQINFAVPALSAGNYPFAITANGLVSHGNVVFVVGP
ncbi:MAG TPA: cellulase family glycosylhydrolase [Bryobacteraceae bacterium]|nr:cellulase family glycosylhydrolase [Bryobacteraceae bacterium]